VKRATRQDTALARAFLAESRRRLRREYLPKLRQAVAPLTAAELWWRPNPHSNSIGNLLLHLEGNIRQWIVSGIGGRSDRRDRDGEFAAQTGTSARHLLARLGRTLGEVDAVLAGLEPDAMLERRRIQGYDITVLQAIYHVVEHFSGHTGQILYAVKLRRGRDLEFYPHLSPRRGAVRKAASVGPTGRGSTRRTKSRSERGRGRGRYM